MYWASTGRTQSLPPPFTPRRERASGKALALLGHYTPKRGMIASREMKHILRTRAFWKWLLWPIAPLFFCGATLLAQVQAITGTWQGTVTFSGRHFRAQIRISQATDNTLKAVLYSVDQNGDPNPASGIHLDGSIGTYEGKLSPSGNSIEGTWTSGSQSQPLNLDRANAETAWTIPAPTLHMPINADPSFDVVSIKLSVPGKPGNGFGMRGHEFLTYNTTASDLIKFAYRLNAQEIIGGPDWLDKEKYDVTGTPDTPGEPNPEQQRTMFKKLLANRFQLAFHREKKRLAVYAIGVDKSGPKLNRSAADPSESPVLNFPKIGVLVCAHASMSDLGEIMQEPILDRPVVDQTGLAGRYDFKLTWTPTGSEFAEYGVHAPASAGDDPNAPPDLFTAMRQQLGLRLKATKASVDAIVIDHIEQPSPN
jgi:uncharacterized protein (TIGR03435 family)